MSNIIDDIFDPDRIVLYKCPNGHVMGIPLHKYEAGNVQCEECVLASIDMAGNIRKILSEAN